nr:uncharacterized protein LOC112132395 [Pongo abelii]
MIISLLAAALGLRFQIRGPGAERPARGGAKLWGQGVALSERPGTDRPAEGCRGAGKAGVRSARGAGALRRPRATGLAAGSSASGFGRRGSRSVLSLLPIPSPEFSASAAPGTPLPALPAALGRLHGAKVPGLRPRARAGNGFQLFLGPDPRPRTRPPAHALGARAHRGGSAWKRSPTSSPSCSEGNPESAGNDPNCQPAPLQPALALLKTSSSHQSLASLYPESPAQVKEPKRKARSHTLTWLKP